MSRRRKLPRSRRRVVARQKAKQVIESRGLDADPRPVVGRSKPQPFVAPFDKLGRNDPCPRHGTKLKRCCWEDVRELRGSQWGGP